MPASFIRHVVEQHAEEAGFIWLLRTNAAANGYVRLRELEKFDARTEAHLDGLRLAGECGLDVCEQAVVTAPRSVFPTAVLALEGQDPDRLARLLAATEADPEKQRGLFAAFGWISAHYLQGTAKELLNSRSPFRRSLGIACCVMHGVDPGAPLNEAINATDAHLRARALAAAGELGKDELRAPCERICPDHDAASRVASAWSAVLLGNRGAALENLAGFAIQPGTNRERAFQLALQAMSVTASHRFLRQLANEPAERRWLIQGSGIAGDPTYIPWLIAQLVDGKTARLAAEAFTLITGVDFARDGLEGDRPQDADAGPNDDPTDPNVDMDTDEGLPWPDVGKIETWWAANQRRFQKGTRYFMGAPVTREHCIDVLKNGYQRQRILAAHYRCLLEPGTPLFNTSAPAWRQKRLLAKMT